MIEESGVRVRLYERAPGSLLYRELRRDDGSKDRKSLGHRDRALGEQQVRQLARRMAELRLTGGTHAVTFGQLLVLYLAHKAPLLSDGRRELVTRTFVPYFTAHLGGDFPLENLSQTHLDAYVAARRAGAIRSAKHRGVSTPPRDGTIRSELNWLKALIHWGQAFKVNGRRLIAGDPLDGLQLVREKNPRRPVASEDRYQRTLAVADAIDAWGRLACMLALARHTGRRVNAICQLRADDVVRSRDEVLRALAAAGRDEREATYMPHGAIRWRADSDKLGFEEFTAINAAARAALDRYLRRHPRLGAAPLFPDLDQLDVAMTRAAADHLLRSAEQRAGLPKLERGLWHAYRRLWASERKHQSDVDTAKAGGWRDLATMKQSYQQADPATVLKVIENAPAGLTSDTPATASGDGATS